MRFVLKVLVLVGLIALGKWEKNTSVAASKSANSLLYPVYSQNMEDSVPPKPVPTAQDIRRVSIDLNY